jgi:hypothetical protein
MNIREELQRHLIETNRVMQTRRYNWLWATALALSLFSVFHVFEPEFWQMRRLRSHIEDISPQWDAFKHAHPGFEAVELFPEFDEGYGVRFAAKGQVPWSVDVNQLAEFMRSTKQPFAIDVLQVSKDFSNASPTPGYKKMSVVLIDGRRIEILVPTEPYHGSDETSARSKAEPGSPANGSQPIRSETNSTSSAAGSRR